MVVRLPLAIMAFMAATSLPCSCLDKEFTFFLDLWIPPQADDDVGLCVAGADVAGGGLVGAGARAASSPGLCST